MGAYVFDNSWEPELQRLAGLQASLDTGTTRHLEGLGVRRGWACLEVGGGAGSIARWLSAKVGESGSVVATDIDTRFLDALDEPNLEVRRHDVVVDDLPEDAFDLVHARLLLAYLPDREVALKKMVNALKPGGCILVEDLDWRGMLAKPPVVHVYPHAAARSSVRVWRAALDVMSRSGYDLSFGWRLPALLAGQGLVEVDAEVRAPIVWGGTPGTAAVRWTIERLREPLIESGSLTEPDIDRELARLDDPGAGAAPWLMVAAWGRRPGYLTALHKEGALPPRHQTMAERLRSVPLLASCTPEEIERLATLPQVAEVPAGWILTHEGKDEDLFYIVVSGTATVTREGRRLATLGPGAFFGEMALLSKGPRTATVTSDTAMRLIVFDEESFGAMLEGSPDVARKILEGVAERLQRDVEDQRGR